MRTTPDIPELRSLTEDADHVDVKVAEAALTLREYAAATLSWQPAWLTALFRVRDVFARGAGLETTAGRMGRRLRPEDVPFTPGAPVHFFTVTEAAEDRYLVLEAADSHLTAYLAIMARPDGDLNRFEVVTVVKYHRRLGSLYFNLIRPFHHLVVAGMARAGARAARGGRS
ncbi:DUF2867 domain-containing protein [Thermomonospora cellulosilytica]|uniref:DUF2867 domain-containing protein n=1 Tax=Thermomonospora cellulosilytica TaxID=1411118 RepID=A0A7W3RBR9_9ACTN|nr:DUF2867 domain-containing protein [Thermomonospora cellulosilytica]MBA9007079.1 hypothetical protein [Thermomonospora cellulosilytica]